MDHMLTTAAAAGPDTLAVAEHENVWTTIKTTTTKSTSQEESASIKGGEPKDGAEEEGWDMEELIRREGKDNKDLYQQLRLSGGKSGGAKSYSTQTIRQRKGRRLVSSLQVTEGTADMTMAATSTGSSPTTPPSSAGISVSETAAEEAHAAKGATHSLTTTTSTVTRKGTREGEGQSFLKKPSTGFPSVGLYQGLGRLQAFSAMAFGSFAVLHLIPPMLASVGGVDLANKALIWGRVYYQTFGVEELMVYGSLMVHLGTGLCRAAVRLIWKVKAKYASRKHITSASDTSLSSSGPRTTTTTTTTSSSSSSGSSGSATAPGLFPFHRLVGWLLTPLVLGHMNTMRFRPIEILGDSSMVDYSLVTYLHRMGHRAPYIALVGFLVYHAVGGGPVAFNMALPQGSKRRIKVQELIQSKPVRAVVSGVVVTVAMVGVYRILTAPGFIPMHRQFKLL